jgi:hypothetical protein
MYALQTKTVEGWHTEFEFPRAHCELMLNWLYATIKHWDYRLWRVVAVKD